MPRFIVIPTKLSSIPTPRSLDRVIEELDFGNNAIRLPGGEWLISYDGTSQQLAEKILGIGEDNDSDLVPIPGLVLGFNNYWGFADNSIWEWMSKNGDE